MPPSRTALGGLPLAAAGARRAGRTATVRRAVPSTSRDELLSLLRRKGWQLQDVERHPVVLGVPLGQDGGSSRGVSIDMGMKIPAVVSLSELSDASTDFKRKLIERALDGDSDGQQESTHELLRGTDPVPMVVQVKEDMMNLPIASALHRSGLEKDLPDEKLRLLSDKFFRSANSSGIPSREILDLLVEAVPNADPAVEARDTHRREEVCTPIHSPRSSTLSLCTCVERCAGFTSRLFESCPLQRAAMHAARSAASSGPAR